MPSDIYVKKSTGWSTPVTKIFAKTNSGWSTAIRYVYAKINAGWTRVWPLSGVYPTTNPFISNNTTTTSEISYGTVLRVGTTYKGDRGVWNPNGYTIGSYDYKWMSYSAENGGTANIDPTYTNITTSTQSVTFTITGTPAANYDRGWITFRVRANASNSAYSGTADSLRYYVARQKPRLATGGNPVLSNYSPAVGDTISYSSSWDISDAYKPEANRGTIKWYRSTSTGLTETQLKALTPIQSSGYSYTTTASDQNNYIYAMEEVFNSGTDLESLTNGVTAIVRTTSLVSASISAFTYSIYNGSTVTTPSTPTQTRVSSTSNDVLIEFASSTPADTLDHTLYWSGSGSASTGNITIGTLNQYTNSADYSLPIATSANNSPINTYVVANGIYRDIYVTLSSTTGASSWGVNFTWSNSVAYGLTYYSNGTALTSSTTGSTVTTLSNSVDANNRILIARVSGAGNPTVTINSVTAYASTGQTGTQKAGTAGTPTSLSSIPRPTATSGTSTSNYTYYSNNQLTGSQRRVLLPSVFNSGTTLYVSTNGYINWGGQDPAGAINILTGNNNGPLSGITLAPLNADLRQGATTSTSNTSIGGLWTLADSSNFYVTWWGNQYQDSVQVARYQVKFYWGQSYADVIIINNSLNAGTLSTVAVQNGSTTYQDWSGTSAQTSTQISTATMNRDSTSDGLDDGRTVINAVQPVAPSGGSAYMGNASGSAISSINNGGTIYLWRTNATGSPAPNATWVWQRNDGAGSAYVTRQTGGDTYTTGVVDSGFRIQAVVTWSNGVSPNQVYTTPTTVLVGQAQYTVTWDAVTNGGTGGGTTTQNSGLSHTAPSASKTSYTVSYSSTGQTSGSAPSATQAYFTNTGYYDYIASNPNQTGPIAIGGSFTPSSNITMYMRYGSTSQAVTLSNQGTLLRTGYTFGGWNIGGTTYSAGSSYTPTANVTATAVWNQNVIAPSGGTVSISTNTGNYSVGSVITYSTSGWANSPTSYYLELHNGTNPVLTSDPLRASTTSTSGTYTITSSDVPNYFKAWATATNSAGSTQASSSQVGPAYTPVSIPSGGSVTLSGTAAVGQVLSASTSGWSGSPTSYDIRIVRGTAGVIISETLKASSTTSSVSYTVQAGDVGYYFKAFAAATNSAGTSGFASSIEKGPVPSSAVAPSTPGTPTLTYNSAGNTTGNYGYTATWANSSTGTAPISYYLRCYGSSDNYVSQQQLRGPFSTGSTAQSFSLPTSSGLWKVAAYATNSAGTSGDSTKSNGA